jgi:hypothetical protein
MWVVGATMTEKSSDDNNQTTDGVSEMRGSLQGKAQRGRTALVRFAGFLARFGILWRSSRVIAFLSAMLVFAGRSGFVFASKIEFLPLPESGSVPAGIIYFLPKALIDIEANYRITRCDIEWQDEAKPPIVIFDADVSAW